MITLHLTGQSEKLAPHNPWNLDPAPLYHQVRTTVALQDPDVHLVVNSYNTGTGKTRAALLHLFAINGQKKDVLFVAPTNALLGQHTEDVRAFVQAHNLAFQVVPATAATVRHFGRQLVEQGDYGQMRPGETLERLIRNYREFFPEAQQRQGLILVVNPDIFYYAMTFQYGGHDQRNLFQRFLTAFNYVIIDEFHYYDQKQLAFFLFFFTISKELGYFTHAGRKICLLSATPNSHVVNYLHKVFGRQWQHVSPDNEPPESAAYPTVPALAPLTLTIGQDDLVDWGQAHGRTLRRWIEDEDWDGAIISDSLRRINRLYAALRPHLSESQMGRITGPEPEAARQKATARSLILATPTVDIGYNFKKLGKERQNIDFLVCEARFGDDLIQRLGRAGRILGKTELDVPSQAVALLRDAAVDALRPYDGQTLTRAQFKDIVQQNEDALPQKHNLTGYIRTWAITELFYPIYQARRLAMQDEQPLLEALYQQLRDVFDVRGGTFRSLSAYFRKYYYRRQWLDETKNKVPHTLETAGHVADWFRFQGEGEYSPADLLPHLQHENVLGSPEREAALRHFVAGQVHLTNSLFNFRDSFQGPTAVVYDPEHLLSGEAINTYDLLHLVESYHLQWLTGRSEFIQLCGETTIQGDFYGRIRSHRDPLLSLELRYRTGEYEEDFRRQWEGRPVALSGFQLVARERQGDRVAIDERIVTAFQNDYLTVLLVAPDMKGWAIRALKNSPLYGRRLTIDFYDHQNVEYTVYIGKAAWLAFPELQFAYKIRDRMKSEAIIL